MLYKFNNIVTKKIAICIVLVLSLVLLGDSIALGKKATLRRGRVSSKSLRTMARVYMAYGEYEKAQPLIDKALSLVRKTNDRDYELAMCLIDTAYLYKKQNKLASAEEMCKQGLELQQELLYENHPYIAHTFRILSSIYMEQGELLQAESALEKATAIIRICHTEDDYEMVSLEMDTAKLLVVQGFLAKAESHYCHVLSVINKRSPNHFYKASVLEDLAKLSLRQGKYVEAELQIDQVLSMKEKIYGTGHYFLVPALFVKARIEREKGNYSASEIYIQRALATVQTTKNLTKIVAVQQHAERIRTEKVIAGDLVAKAVPQKTRF